MKLFPINFHFMLHVYKISCLSKNCNSLKFRFSYSNKEKDHFYLTYFLCYFSKGGKLTWKLTYDPPAWDCDPYGCDVKVIRDVQQEG